MTDNATVRTVEHDMPSDLPETGWLWRRVFAFGFTVSMILFAWRVSERIHDGESLRMALRYAFWALFLMSLLYMAGASAEAITKLIGAIRTTRRETITTAPPPAQITAGPDGARVETPPAVEHDQPPWAPRP